MTDMPSSPEYVSQALSLLDGRFFRPPLPDGYVARPALCQRLQAGANGRLLLVTAAAGFGKSSLAIEFCESLPLTWRSLWLGLSARDAEPGRFFERLIAGLQHHCPTVGAQAMGLLKLRQPHQPFAYDTCLESLLDELSMYVQADAPLLLVLDDYHLAQGAVLDRCLQCVLNHRPAGLVLLVTSRQRPDWHLARLRLSRQVVELTEQDLRLTPTQALAVLGCQPSDAHDPALDTLVQRSEGWVAGLRFWQLAASEAGALNAVPNVLHGGERLVRDYLLEEVIELLAPPVQAFLYDTACQDRFCAALCDAVRERQDSAAMLDFLQAHQVFLVPLDEHGRWFRYHHLFSDLLRSRQADPLLPGPHVRACDWFRQHGLLDEAVEQALRAGDLPAAAELVQRLSEEQLLAEQNVAMLLRWKMDLPDSLLISSPRLIVLYSWALALACQLDAAQALAAHLSRFLPAPSASAQRSMLAQWLALSGLIARGRGQRERALTYCQEALASLPEKRYGQRLVCLSTLSNLAIAEGDFWQARSCNRDALELAQRVGNPLFEALAHYDRARVLHARGQVLRAQDEVQQGLQRLHGLPAQRLYAVRARLTLYDGYLLVSRLQLADGRARLRAGLSEARACRDISVLIGHCVLASLEGREGRLAHAFAELAEAERLMHIWDVPAIFYLAMITTVKCELWLAQDRTDLAEAWLQRLAQTYRGAQAAAAPEFQPLLALHIELQQALLEARQGQPGQAAIRLQGLVAQGQAADNQMLCASALCQWLGVLLDARQWSTAAALLAQALAAAQGGALLPFQRLIEAHPHWLREQLALHPASAVQAALLAHLPAAPAGPVADPLSARELAVLALIAQGCSNQQISEQLFISLHTVKTHASHINSKLGVERRTQAVARAKSLGLLA